MWSLFRSVVFTPIMFLFPLQGNKQMKGTQTNEPFQMRISGKKTDSGNLNSTWNYSTLKLRFKPMGKILIQLYAILLLNIFHYKKGLLKAIRIRWQVIQVPPGTICNKMIPSFAMVMKWFVFRNPQYQSEQLLLYKKGKVLCRLNSMIQFVLLLSTKLKPSSRPL